MVPRDNIGLGRLVEMEKKFIDYCSYKFASGPLRRQWPWPHSLNEKAFGCYRFNLARGPLRRQWPWPLRQQKNQQNIIFCLYKFAGGPLRQQWPWPPGQNEKIYQLLSIKGWRMVH